MGTRTNNTRNTAYNGTGMGENTRRNNKPKKHKQTETIEPQNRQNAPPDNKQPISIHLDLQYIRTNSLLHQTLKNQPILHEMLTREYTKQEINQAITQLKNRKAHGTDGIPGEVYEELKDWI